MEKPSVVFYLVVMTFVCTAICLPATAQQLTQPTVQPAALQSPIFNRGQFNTGPQVAPVSLTTPARVLQETNQPTSDRQIRVDIRFLRVDDETRELIYQQLGTENIQTQTQRIPLNDSVSQLSNQVSQGNHLRSSRQTLTTSCVSTCVLSEKMSKELMEQVELSVASGIWAAPTMTLFDGQDGRMTDMVQRPFVVDLPELVPGAAGAKTDAKSLTQVLDEGTALRIKVQTRDEESFHLVSELAYTRITDLQTRRVFGVRSSNTSLQVPMHEIESVAVAQEMVFGQTLLLDPYVTREIELKKEQDAPFLSKIPYMNKFRNVAAAKVNTNLMVMIQPKIIK